SQTRYPVVYWLHGFESSAILESQSKEFANFVAAHDAIVVDYGPAQATGEFPLYFPELVDQVDRTLRTVADRDHRAISGYAPGGFLAEWTAGKFPDLVSSASGVSPTTEAQVGPKGFEVDCNLDELTHDGVRVAS